jgi:hypothetical protein
MNFVKIWQRDSNRSFYRNSTGLKTKSIHLLKSHHEGQPITTGYCWQTAMKKLWNIWLHMHNRKIFPSYQICRHSKRRFGLHVKNESAIHNWQFAFFAHKINSFQHQVELSSDVLDKFLICVCVFREHFERLHWPGAKCKISLLLQLEGNLTPRFCRSNFPSK